MKEVVVTMVQCSRTKGTLITEKSQEAAAETAAAVIKWEGEYGILKVQVSDRQGTKEEEGFFVYFMSLLGMA